MNGWPVQQRQNAERGVITLNHLRIEYGGKQNKTRKATSPTSPYKGCEYCKAKQHYAETRAPPSQEPRDHIEQAVRA